jgi:F420-dependent oxidoreductase-like protein
MSTSIRSGWTRRRILQIGAAALPAWAAIMAGARLAGAAARAGHGRATSSPAAGTPAAASPTPAAQPASAGGTLRFGVQPRPEHARYADVVETWRLADDLGLDSAFVFDHFMPIDGRDGPCLEGWTLLAALAAQTRRIRVGVLVTGNTYRNPAILAKMAATVDHVSDGRLILGMGAGWFEAEHTAYGIPFYTPGERARRLVEAVKVVIQLFTNERSTFDGRYYTLKNAPLDPKPLQRPHPPILIGGMGPKVLQPLAAAYADVWHFSLPSADPEDARRLTLDFDALCRAAGRDPAAVARATTLEPRVLAGLGVDAARDKIRALHDAGVQHFILALPAPYDHALLRRFGEEIVPGLRTA